MGMLRENDRDPHAPSQVPGHAGFSGNTLIRAKSAISPASVHAPLENATNSLELEPAGRFAAVGVPSPLFFHPRRQQNFASGYFWRKNHHSLAILPLEH